LKGAVAGSPLSARWRDIAQIRTVPEGLFESVPYMLVDDRSDLVAFLGFRHVTGIKEWSPTEKAEYIGRLADVEQMTYQQIARKIGSKQDVVRRNYIAYRILVQLEAMGDVEMSYIESVQHSLPVTPRARCA